MFEYFRGWQRKVGIVTLILACLFAAAWMRSFETINRFMMKTAPYEFNWFASTNASLVWQHIVPVDEAGLSKKYGDENAAALFGQAAEGLAEYLLAETLGGESPFRWNYQHFGVEVGEYRKEGSVPMRVTVRKLSHWLLITPLTLISAYLLLSKPRPKQATIQLEISPLRGTS